MDGAVFRERSKRAVTAAWLLGVVGVLTTPVAALGATPTPVPTDPRQVAIDARRSGPGFDVHTQVVNNEKHTDVNVCSRAAGPNHAHCDARVRTDVPARGAHPARAGQPQPAAALGNNGAYDPAYLQSAYNLAGLVQAGAGRNQVVAIVDAYDSPTAEFDLAKYRSFFGLSALPTCSTWPSPTACLRTINQNGATSPLPATDTGWAAEIALDLDMVSAICPNCSILLVEANSTSYFDLTTGVNKAVSEGANVVSNSYGGGEWSGETGLDDAYNHPGRALTVSSGDAGFGTAWPAASPYVTAVGGTTLNQATNTGTRDGTESAWSGSGSGCSAYEPKPGWQKDVLCSNRTVADVSAVADPNTGVWVYDTTGGTGWAIYGGTSVAAPIVGSVYALAANSPSSGVTLSSDPYGQPGSLFDVTSGSNGSCGATYLCNASPGYDGPTGLGTPNGDTAFSNASNVSQPRADFSLALQTTSLTVTRGGTSVTDTLTLSALNGYHSGVTLSVANVPAGVNASFSPNAVTPTASSPLSVRATRRTPPGTYALTIVAKGADGTIHTSILAVAVQ